MAYVKQKPTAERSPAREATASILPNGSIRLNKEATTLLLAHEAKGASLLTDETERRFKITLTSQRDIEAYRLTYSKQLNWAQFAPKAALKRLGWTGKRSFRVPLHWERGSFYGTVPSSLST